MTTNTRLYHAFVDESGNVTPFTSDETFLIIAVLVVTHPRPLELIIKRAFRRFGPNLPGEMKATHSKDKTILWILEAIARQKVEIVAVVVDKRGIIKPLNDPEALYRQAMARAIRHCVARWPRLKITIDKRYTHRHLRQKLERAIREEITRVTEQMVLIEQIDSLGAKGLQVIDYVAWALRQKYQRGNTSYYQVIEDKIVIEKVVKAK